MDYVGNSEEPAHQSHEYASTSRLHVVFACDGLLTTWSKIQRCAGRPKDTPGNVVASCILFACSDALGPDSEHRRAVQVEMIVHSKQRRRFAGKRCWDGWVNLSTPRLSILKLSLSTLDAINRLPRTKPSSNSTPRRRGRSPSTAKETWRFISPPERTWLERLGGWHSAGGGLAGAGAAPAGSSAPYYGWSYESNIHKYWIQDQT